MKNVRVKVKIDYIIRSFYTSAWYRRILLDINKCDYICSHEFWYKKKLEIEGIIVDLVFVTTVRYAMGWLLLF